MMGHKKDIYKADLDFRFPGRAFTETPENDFTRVNYTGTFGIDSVSDSGGTARFHVSPGELLYVGLGIKLTGFVTNTGYNVTGNITATDGSTYFEIAGVGWGSDESVGSIKAFYYSISCLDVDDAYESIRINLVGSPIIEPLEDHYAIVATSDNSVTTIHAVPIADETSNLCHVKVFGIEADHSNRAVYEVVVGVYRTGGGDTVKLGSDTVEFAGETSVSWGGPSFAVSGTDLLIQVQGAANTDINWQCDHTLETFTH